MIFLLTFMRILVVTKRGNGQKNRKSAEKFTKNYKIVKKKCSKRRNIINLYIYHSIAIYVLYSNLNSDD